MIYGFSDCEAQQTPNCTPQRVSEYRDGPTLMFLSLQGNIFEGTSQRMPRASGRVFAHVFNNIFAFQPLRHPDGRPFTSSYAAVALSGGSLLVEQNWFGQLTKTKGRPLAAWTISTPGAMRMPNESEGSLRAVANLTAADEIVGESRPQSVVEPAYRAHETILDFTRLGAEHAGACVLRRAGPGGPLAWDTGLCGN
jgi:pectate lyase